MNEKLQYQIALTQIPGVGDVLAKSLVSYCGGVEEVFHASRQQLLKVPGVGKATIEEILFPGEALERAAEEIEFIEKEQLQVLFFLDQKYPQRLKRCPDAPTTLYYRGNANLNQSRMINVIGTRNATRYGKEICQDIAEQLAPYNITILSGLAYGIDAAIHKACLENKIPTIAVLGHGLDIIYPAQHSHLARQMVQQGGGILTEFKSNTKANRENFPKRNRIVAGMSDATIVVETATEGGSVTTVQYAYSYNRDVFAFPGRIKDPYSKGCNQLIKQKIATLIDSPSDIAELLGWQKPSDHPRQIQRQLFVELDEEEQQMLEFLQQQDETTIDQLMQKTHFTNSKVARLLLSLELKGLVRALPGSAYAIV